MVRRVQLFANHFIQRRQQALTRGEAVHGDVFHPVRDPDVHHRWRAQLLAKVRRHAAAGLHVVDPELTNFVIGVGEGKAVGAQRMREAGRVKIQPQLVGFRPLDPVLKVFRLDGVAIDRRVGLQIDSVQVQAFWPRDQAQGQFQIGPQLGGVTRLARIVTCGLDAAGQRTAWVLKPGDIIALPAVHRDGQTVELTQSLLDIHAHGGETLFSQFPGLFKLSGHAQSSLVGRCC